MNLIRLQRRLPPLRRPRGQDPAPLPTRDFWGPLRRRLRRRALQALLAEDPEQGWQLVWQQLRLILGARVDPEFPFRGAALLEDPVLWRAYKPQLEEERAFYLEELRRRPRGPRARRGRQAARAGWRRAMRDAEPGRGGPSRDVAAATCSNSFERLR